MNFLRLRNLNLELAIAGTNFKNSYDFWVYPDAVDTDPGKAMVCREFDDNARRVLAKGGSVLLLPEPAKLANSIEGAFAPDFWNFGMFKKFALERHFPVAPGTLGILCDPEASGVCGVSHRFSRKLAMVPSAEKLPGDDFRLDAQGLSAAFAGDRQLRAIAQAGRRYSRSKSGRENCLSARSISLRCKTSPRDGSYCTVCLQYMNSEKFNPATSVDEATVENILQMKH